MKSQARGDTNGGTDAHPVAANAYVESRDLTDEETDGVNGGWLPKFMQPPSNFDRALAKFRPK